MMRQVERFAPGFRDRSLACHVLDPEELQARNAKLVHGDVGGRSYGGLQSVFRPLPAVSPSGHCAHRSPGSCETPASSLTTKHSLPLLRASRGLIVNLASIAGKDGNPGLAAYGATNAAVVSVAARNDSDQQSDRLTTSKHAAAHPGAFHVVAVAGLEEVLGSAAASPASHAGSTTARLQPMRLALAFEIGQASHYPRTLSERE